MTLAMPKKRGKKKKSIDPKIDFDMNLPAQEARSKSASTAKKILRSKMEQDLVRRRGENYTGPFRAGIEMPETELFQDTKTGEYIAKEKLSSPAYRKGGKRYIKKSGKVRRRRTKKK